jgi:hypothetical protein
MLTLLFLSALAAPPDGTDTPEPEGLEATLRPGAVAELVGAEPVKLVVTSDPLGNSDDRTATRLEETLREREGEIVACWHAARARGVEPFRYIQVQVKMSSVKGTVTKAKVRSSTGDELLDACASDLVASHVLTPPPQFPDRAEVNITWALPPEDTEEE